MPISNFTHHATARVKERTQLSNQQVVEMIADKTAVNLGAKPGINKVHWLLYSTVDAAHYVIVQDSLDGTIITFLPWEYHVNLAWSITELQKSQAFELAKNAEIQSKARADLSQLENLQQRVIHIRFRYLNQMGEIKFKTVDKMNSQMHNHCLLTAVQWVIEKFDAPAAARQHHILWESITNILVGNCKNQSLVKIVNTHQLKFSSNMLP